MLLIAVAAVYAGTLSSPFVWDESAYITGSPVVKDLAYLADPSRADALGMGNALRARYIGYLTFALDFRAHGMSLKWMHAENIALNALNATLLMLILMRLMRGRARGGLIAWAAAMAFALHPLATEAVNYLYQRFVPLAAACSLGAIYLYARAFDDDRPRLMPYLGAILMSAMAMKCKESAFTLPMIIALYDAAFLGGQWRARLIRVIPVLMTMAIVPAGLLTAAPERAAHAGYGALDYALTQPGVVLRYMELFFIPAGQSLFHNIPLQTSIASAAVLAPLAVLMAIAVTAVLLWRKGLRVAAFGIGWFLIALAIESSAIPIPMLMNEYRAYFPMAGLVAACIGLTGRVKPLHLVAALVAASIAFGAVTYQRNAVWASRVTLWEDAAAKYPGGTVALNNLGLAYYDSGMPREAGENYLKALDAAPDNTDALNNLGMLVADQDLQDEAAKYFRQAIASDPYNAAAYLNLGSALFKTGRMDEAAEMYAQALRLRPGYAEALTDLGTVSILQGKAGLAVEYFAEAVRLHPDMADARFNLGVLLLNSGDRDGAMREFEAVLRMKPGDKEAAALLNAIR